MWNLVGIVVFWRFAGLRCCWQVVVSGLFVGVPFAVETGGWMVGRFAAWLVVAGCFVGCGGLLLSWLSIFRFPGGLCLGCYNMMFVGFCGFLGFGTYF